MAGNKQRRFTDDFKREAVRLVESARQGIERTARDSSPSCCERRRKPAKFQEVSRFPRSTVRMFRTASNVH